MIPDELVRKAARAILRLDALNIEYCSSWNRERAEKIVRAALEAAGVAEMIGAFDGLAEQCEMLRRDLAEAEKERDLLADEARAFRLEAQKRDEAVLRVAIQACADTLEPLRAARLVATAAPSAAETTNGPPAITKGDT